MTAELAQLWDEVVAVDLQHVPTRALVGRLFAEVGRVLAPDGEAFLHLPQLRGGVVPLLRRGVRSAGMRLRVSEDVTTSHYGRSVELLLRLSR